MEKTLWDHVLRVRETSPLVHNITNFVVMNNTANAVLAVGASPIMAHAHSEVEAMTELCASLVVNIGTLDEYWVESMLLAAHEAARLEKPWVFDPVGAGATPYRDDVSARILALRPTVVRGNASEIMSLARANTSATKGVDSTAASDEAVVAARWLNAEFGSVICISGETDIIVSCDRSGGGANSGGTTILVHNGSTMMTRVTGLGCSASAVIGAFVAVASGEEEDASKREASDSATLTEAVAAATALFAICGEIAAESAPGPGTLQLALLDKLYNITEAEFVSRLKIETV